MDGARCRPTRGGEFIRSASKSLTPFSRKLLAIQSIGVIFALELFFFLNTLVGFVASLVDRGDKIFEFCKQWNVQFRS